MFKPDPFRVLEALARESAPRRPVAAREFRRARPGHGTLLAGFDDFSTAATEVGGS